MAAYCVKCGEMAHLRGNSVRMIQSGMTPAECRGKAPADPLRQIDSRRVGPVLQSAWDSFRALRFVITYLWCYRDSLFIRSRCKAGV